MRNQYTESRRQLKLFAACERRGSMQARNAIFDGALNKSPMSTLLLALLMGDEEQAKLSSESLSITECQLANLVTHCKRFGLRWSVTEGEVA